MENASKAIIIAGAVLIVLAVLSLGVAIFFNSQLFINIFTKDITKTEILNHNANFSNYDGEVIGAQVISACMKAREINNQQKRINMHINVIIGSSTYSFDANSVDSYDYIINIIGKEYRSNVFIGKTAMETNGIISNIIFTKQ